ncbi:ATP-binding response regulator [Azospirillum halopraeferens]|uniref:ATP-binding response regulator n=1 Tax=Azospirillum halopraeferens TaxID=34010 RepID=UPI00068840B5|nr:ATP-binding protein [Azospirillum halopraeferens]
MKRYLLPAGPRPRDAAAADAPGAPAGWGVRRHLVALVLAVTLPMVTLAGVLSVRLAHVQGATLERSLDETARALALALDADIGGVAAVLEAAMLAGGLPAADPERFAATAAALMAAQPSWRSLFLTDPYGHTLVRAGEAPDAAAGAAVAATVRAVIIGNRMMVSDLLPAPAGGSPVVALAVPVRREGAAEGPVDGVLGVTLAAARWSRMLQEHRVPPEWLGVVVDGGGTVLARARDAIDYVGRRAPDWYIAATADAEAGIAEGMALQGHTVTLAFRRSPLSGWTLAYAAPSTVVERPLWESVWTALLAGTALTLLAGLLALRIGRRIAEPLRSLAAAARSGAPVPPLPASAAREVNELRSALATAAGELGAAAAERERLLAREADRRREAEQANAAKSRFLAAASHDLRQPFQATRLYHHLLADHLADAKGRDLHERLGTALTSGETLLNALLDVSTLEAGTVRPVRSPFPVQDLLDAKLAEVQEAAAAKGVRVTCRPCPAIVDSDPMLLGRILGNLLGNAVRYTTAGRILVAGRRRGGALRIEVWDTGVGIPADKLECVFEDFVQIANPQRDHRHGLGLGLAVVRRTAALLGHPVTVCSRPGRGSCFAVTVPFAAAGPLALPPPRSAAAPAATRRSLSILVVEDHPDQRAALVRLLEDAGHRVTAAGDGDEALAVRLSGPPDLVLSDFRLPGGLDGIELVRRLGVRFGRRLPAAILTGDTDPSLLRRADHHGLRLLHKPTGPADLHAAIADLTRPPAGGGR